MRVLFLAVLLFGAPSLVLAAPLPEDARLDARVSLEVRDQPVSAIVARLAEASGVKLAADDTTGESSFVLCVRDCPLRDVMAGLAQATRVSWEADGAQGFRLGGVLPATPPFTDTARLLKLLEQATPPWVRQAPTSTRSSYDCRALYAALTPAQQGAIEGGGQVPYEQLPTPAQRLLLERQVGPSASSLRSMLEPPWNLAADQLSLHFGPDGQYLPSGWVVEGPPRQFPDGMVMAGPNQVARPTYQPRSESAATVRPGGPSPLTDAVLALAKRSGLSVLLSSGRQAAEKPETGGTPAEQLAGLLTESSRRTYAWQPSGALQVLLRTGLDEPAAPSADAERLRQQLAAGLPPEYAAFLALDAASRSRAVTAAWQRLWQMIPEEQHKPGTKLKVSELPPEQQGALAAVLQMGLVSQYWSMVDRNPADDLPGSTLSFDFENARPVFGTFGGEGVDMGYPRTLVLRVKDAPRTLGQAGPSMLALLPARDPALAKKIDFVMKDQPLADALAQLSEKLGVPLAAAEPAQALQLTGELRQQPARLLFHWLERRTGCQWMKRGETFVLTRPLPMAELTADPKRLFAALAPIIPDPLGDAGRFGPRPSRPNLPADEMAALERGQVPFSQLSPAAKEAVRDVFRREARSAIGGMLRSWEKANAIDQLRFTLETSPVVPPGGKPRYYLTVWGPDGQKQQSFNLEAE